MLTWADFKLPPINLWSAPSIERSKDLIELIESDQETIEPNEVKGKENE